MSGQRIGAEQLRLAQQEYRNCLLCEHRCGVDRSGGERGFCLATADARVYRCRVECGEEIELIPSLLLYLSGCNLRCAFCVGEADAFDPRRGSPLTSRLLTDALAAGRERGARYLQWVGGEPTIHIPAILQAMAGCDSLLPVVWKSDFYGTIESFALLDGVVDVHVADLKFGNDICARQIAGVDQYMQIVTRNLLLAGQTARLIVRHLLLPGHNECCFRPIVDWMGCHLPAAPFRVMTGYLPRWKAVHHPTLAFPLGRQAGDEAIALAREKGLNVIE
jgi:putative pyruvate formate lyase activating enzyme